MEELFTAKGIIGLLLLTLVELVLVVDNALVIILQCKAVPPSHRAWTERVALLQGALIRIALLTMLSWLSALAEPIPFFSHAFEMDVSIRTLIELAGGAVLMWIAIQHYNEIGHHHHHTRTKEHAVWWKVLLQLLGVNVIFSLDSVLSAMGTVDSYTVMVTAVLISVVVLISAVGAVSRIIEGNPNLKVFALSLVFLIGGFLFAEGLGAHIEKSQLYAAMGFGLFVQLAYMNKRNKLYSNPVETAKIESLSDALSEAEKL
ncbi:MAG: hypothetical protein KDD60_01240 [Bdellovibrionales bacterium]|nr:hypothetical protein [Bdellovibrionales bacterium]